MATRAEPSLRRMKSRSPLRLLYPLADDVCDALPLRQRRDSELLALGDKLGASRLLVELAAAFEPQLAEERHEVHVPQRLEHRGEGRRRRLFVERRPRHLDRRAAVADRGVAHKRADDTAVPGLVRLQQHAVRAVGRRLEPHVAQPAALHAQVVGPVGDGWRGDHLVLGRREAEHGHVRAEVHIVLVDVATIESHARRPEVLRAASGRHELLSEE
eukprot:1098723-Prymnesium_polylepis.2